MFKVLLLGSTGQIGRCYRDIKINPDLDLICFATKDWNMALEPERGFKIISDISPDLIINASAYTSVEMAEENLEFTRNINFKSVDCLAEISAHINIPIIHFSSDYVFNGKKKGTYIETDILDPLNIYGKTKAEADNSIINKCEKFIIIRTSWVFSKYGNNFVKNILNYSKNKEINVIKDQIGGPTSADCLARIAYFLTEKIYENHTIPWGVYNYSGEPYVSWFDFAKKIVELFNKKYKHMNSCDIVPILTAEADFIKAQRPLNSRLNNKKIHKIFGLNSCDWKYELEKLSQKYFEV